MGTRSLTHVKDEEGKTLCTIYRQFDGYPSGHGQDIFKALGARKLVNGYSDATKEINGMGDVASMLIASIKNPNEAGNVSLRTPDATDCWEEYVYTLYQKHGQIFLKCQTTYNKGELLYDGVLSEFGDYKEPDED